MTGYLVFGGKRSKDFGIYVSGSGTFNAPERDVERIEIPGRNGELVIDSGRFKNESVSYPAFIRTAFRSSADAAREWLLSYPGYRRLEDSYNPEYFRVASFTGPLDFDTRFLNLSGECELTFNCKPQRYLLKGEQILSGNEAMELYNPTGFAAKPLIRVYGSKGTLLAGGMQMQLKTIDGYVDIDCETENAYKGTENCNANIYAPTFPELPEGKTTVSFEGNIEKIEIKPRWWTI